MIICSLPVRPPGCRLAGDAPPALPSLPFWSGGGRKLHFCGWREGAEGGREDLGFSAVLRPPVSVQCEHGVEGAWSSCHGLKGLGEGLELCMRMLGLSSGCALGL